MAQQPGNVATPPPYLRPVRFGAPLQQPIASFVGRRQEIREIRAALSDPGIRLLTLVGPGGVGKTRVALQAAAEVGDSLGRSNFYVALAALESPSGVMGEIATALDASDGGARPVIESVRAAVRNQPTLLILDNVEHLLPEAATVVSELLAACPSLNVLATSRSPLRIYGEHRYPVDPLPVTVPVELREAGNATRAEGNLPDGIRLFVLRARASDPHFQLTDSNLDDIIEICERLDGLPLAIELAAARIAELPPRAYLQRLLRHLPVPGSAPRDLPKRQQTMHAAVGWGYDLLDPDGQRMLRRLAVFVGEFDLEAAEAIAIDIVGEGVHERDGDWSALDLVLQLVEGSLLQRRTDEDGELRFQMLETIREFALQQARISGEEEELYVRHARYYLDLATEANQHITAGRKLVAWLEFVDAHLPNIRSAMMWCHQHDPPAFAQFTRKLVQYWLRRSRILEGVGWLQRARELHAQMPTIEQGWALVNLARLQQYSHDGDVAAYYQAALDIAQAEGDPELEFTVRIGQAVYAALRNQPEDAVAALHAAMSMPDAEHLASHVTQPAFLPTLEALTVGLSGDLERAGRLANVALQRAVETEDEINPALLCRILATVERENSDLEAARRYLFKALETYDAVGEAWNVGSCLIDLAQLFHRDHPELSLRLAGAADRLFAVHGAQRIDPDREPFRSLADDLRHRIGEDAVQAAWRQGVAEPWHNAMEAARTTPVDLRVERPIPDVPILPQGTGGVLSPRELDVLRVMADGLTDREIADALGLRYRTITTYVTNILTKLDVPSRTAAVSLAVRNGFLDS